MDLDTFFVSCERLIDSRLNNLPVIIGGTSDRGVVASCSYEARAFGVHSAMPMKMARERCPEAVIIKGNGDNYTKFSKSVTEIIKEAAPAYEKSSIDEFYLDLTGMDKHFGCLKYTSELRQKIMRETGLPISFGLSSNKTVSKIATGEAKPNNEKYILAGMEKSFLNPLSVKKIPMVGLKTYQTLCSLGAKRIATIQEMPLELMENIMGKHGIAIWKKANGIDLSPVRQYNEHKSISTERTFDSDTTDARKLKSIIRAMAENTAFQLRKRQKVSACITVKIRYSDFQTYTMQKRVPYTAADHEIIQTVSELFDKLFTRRLLVRLVGIRLSDLVTGNHQMRLFEPQADRFAALYQAMDHIRLRYGEQAVIRADGMQILNGRKYKSRMSESVSQFSSLDNPFQF
ncbi:MAG: DNA polymerase IV [Candidatus Fluviicola riflensis]|nr:MAG: DNA polymerase IV [Candidatus Fluviicola riflensis]OGS86135.1 MAG: DNA polymerase IV [Fluviicola sp. RIFCSPHIGHO2_12_FULL_43_24]OGS87238.1 MAG: DNA polymerase IV [Fluviicola sp. RIFCSPHIGHO2_01_FULL_43_53]